MWTIEYKGFYIHGYCDKPECRVLAGSGEVKPAFKSLHAAKCWCTRHLHLYHHQSKPNDNERKWDALGGLHMPYGD